MDERRTGISLDFDAWRALASRDPARYEALRDRVIEAAIRRAPKERQHRLRCLQWRIDAVRRRARNPLAAAIRISDMMSESAARLSEALNGQTAPDRGTARVVPFKQPD